MDMSDEHKVLEAYVEVIDVVEITEYDAETLCLVSEFLEGAARLVSAEWAWTEEGERLWNVPSMYFWKLWRAGKEQLRELGFHPRPEVPEKEGDPKVWYLYFHVDEFLDHPLETVREIDWDLDGATFGSEIAAASASDVPLTEAQKAEMLEILEGMDFLVVSEWQWRANGESLWNYPSKACLRIWETDPALLRQSGFYVFSDEKTHILYFNITDTLRKYILHLTSEPF